MIGSRNEDPETRHRKALSLELTNSRLDSLNTNSPFRNVGTFGSKTRDESTQGAHPAIDRLVEVAAPVQCVATFLTYLG